MTFNEITEAIDKCQENVNALLDLSSQWVNTELGSFEMSTQHEGGTITVDPNDFYNLLTSMNETEKVYVEFENYFNNLKQAISVVHELKEKYSSDEGEPLESDLDE
jgi:hypothetical protein